MEASRLLAAAIERHRRGDLEAAEALFLRVLRAAPGHAHALNSLGIIAAQRGRDESARARFAEAVAAAPEDATGHANLGKALARLGRLEEAVAAFHRALARDPGRAPVHFALGNTLVVSNNLGPASTVVLPPPRFTASTTRALQIASGLPVGTRVTLQAVIQDQGRSAALSTTNAIELEAW